MRWLILFTHNYPINLSEMARIVERNNSTLDGWVKKTYKDFLRIKREGRSILIAPEEQQKIIYIDILIRLEVNRSDIKRFLMLHVGKEFNNNGDKLFYRETVDKIEEYINKRTIDRLEKLKQRKAMREEILKQKFDELDN
jgi:hypothetical protein